MAEPTYNTAFSADADSGNAEQKTFLRGYLFGVPVKDLGLFTSALMSGAIGFAAFFFATFLAIVTVLVLNAGGQRIDYAATYKYVGLPVGLVVLVFASVYLGMLWIRRQITRR
jgi:hypothetical protein